MLQGSINGIEFTLDKGKATASDPYVIELLETLDGIIYNPQEGKTYKTTAGASDLDAYLLLSQLATDTALEVSISNFEGLEVVQDEVGKNYTI